MNTKYLNTLKRRMAVINEALCHTDICNPRYVRLLKQLSDVRYEYLLVSEVL